MFEVVEVEGQKPQLKIINNQQTAGKYLLTASSVIRTLTLMGHQKTSLPLESVFYHYNTLIYLRDGLIKYKEYAKKLFNDAGAYTEVQKIEQSLIHRKFLQTLATLGSKIPDVTTQDDEILRIIGLDELIQIVETHFKSEFDFADTLKAAGKTTHRSLFRCFPPGEVVVGTCSWLPNVKLCYRVNVCRYEAQKSLFGSSSSFNVGLEFIASLGEQFVLLECEEIFSSHDNNKEVFLHELHIRPASVEEKQQLAHRGLQFTKYAVGTSYANYGPKSFFPLKPFFSQGSANLWSNRVKSQGAVSTGGRVMIDSLKGLEMSYSLSTGHNSVDNAVKLAYSRYQAKVRENKKTSDPATLSSDDLILFTSVPPSFHAFCLPVVVGFSFTTKCWGQVLVEECSPIIFNTNAYDMLVLPEERKEMIKALVTNHGKSSFNSLIQGKGEGAVFLFHGASGTGKTLTCEAIAELLRRPLYVVSVGELGTTPQELENNLQAILNLCESWQALILLDEADVFVEKRTRGEILRNSMVGVILRLTEYHRGVIFFTSNRVSSFDPAFQSRVTVAMKYKPLTVDDRKKIWLNLLKSTGTSESDLNKLNLDKLAKFDLNGRQIKNTIQLAVALSCHRNKAIDQEALDSTIQICLDFNADLSDETESKW